MEKKDIFDKLMSLPVLRVFEGFYKKNKAVLLYLFFGGLTTLISIGSFVLLEWVGMETLLANVCSWVAAVSFAYVTNRVWVFASSATGAKAIVREIVAFFGGRLLTLAFEEAVLLVCVHWLSWNSTWVKILAQVCVLVLNFVISKWMVFAKKKA